MTTADLRIPDDVYKAMISDITRTQEWAGYLLCGVMRGSTDLLLAREWCAVPEAMQIKGTAHGFSWHADFDVEMLNRMQREQLAGVVVHYHGGHSPSLSGDDKSTANSLMPFLSDEVMGRPHGFVVFGDRSASGCIYSGGTSSGTLGAIRTVGSFVDDWSPARGISRHDERQDRLIRGFGAESARRLRQVNVGVVGCGGAGSQVIQQLAFLGVGMMNVIDADRVETTNLNRLIGAKPSRSRRTISDRILRRHRGDVGRSKIEVMSEMVCNIDDRIVLHTFAEFFPSVATVAALRHCDVIVACVDRLQVRDDLNRLAKRYLIPLIDVGIEITPEPGARHGIAAITGRVTKVLPSGPCLRCQGVIDDSSLEAERGGKPLGYTGEADIPNPAVVTLNGIVASIAATEVLQQCTGFAPDSPNCGWIYDGLAGTVEKVTKEFRGCPACRAERGRGDA